MTLRPEASCIRPPSLKVALFVSGTSERRNELSPYHGQSEEKDMPVFILWAIPAVIVLGGGAYWIVHSIH